MKITRVYADEQGNSHFDVVEITLRDAGEIGHLSDAVPAKSVVFRRNDPGYDYDWHTAPQRQYIILLDGSIEIEVSSGEKRTFHGGDILLMEDTTGKGHKTRHVVPAERHSVFIILDEKRG